MLGDGTPKIGAHGLPVLFLHPKDFDGTLIELEEVETQTAAGLRQAMATTYVALLYSVHPSRRKATGDE